MKRLKDLQLYQLDLMLTQWREANLPTRPAGGWTRAIRDALGLSAAAFSRRLGMSPAGVHKLELAEARGTITLASLRKLANALDCELQYSLVPRTSLDEILANRARQVALTRLNPVAHSMALEDQSTEAAMRTIQLELLTKEILAGSRRELW